MISSELVWGVIGAVYEATVLFKTINVPWSADHTLSTDAGIAVNIDPVLSWTSTSSNWDWPASIVKLEGLTSIVEMHGSAAGIVICSPLFGFVGTTALSSAKTALAVISSCWDSQVIPVCFRAVNVSLEFENIET